MAAMPVMTVSRMAATAVGTRRLQSWWLVTRTWVRHWARLVHAGLGTAPTVHRGWLQLGLWHRTPTLVTTALLLVCGRRLLHRLGRLLLLLLRLALRSVTLAMTATPGWWTTLSWT